MTNIYHTSVRKYRAILVFFLYIQQSRTWFIMLGQWCFPFLFIVPRAYINRLSFIVDSSTLKREWEEVKKKYYNMKSRNKCVYVYLMVIVWLIFLSINLIHKLNEKSSRLIIALNDFWLLNYTHAGLMSLLGINILSFWIPNILYIYLVFTLVSASVLHYYLQKTQSYNLKL